MHVFYDHLTDLNEVQTILSSQLQPEQVDEILALLDEALHHHVFQVVLDAIPLQTHDQFIKQFAADPSSVDHLTFIRQYAPDIEDQIRIVSQRENQRFIDAIHA